MRRLKWGVCSAFILGFVGLQLYSTDVISGQAGSLSAPTGVTATDNIYSNKVGISWDTIRGATNYRIFRNTTNNSGSATDIGTTPENTFFDIGAPPNTTFFYWVRAENSTTTSAMSSSDQGVRTGTQQQGPIPALEPPPVPPGNPATAAKTYLGKVLFWDEQLSSTRTVSCGTCHHAANGGTDPRSVPATSTSTHPGVDNILGTPDDVRGSAGVPSSNPDGTYVSLPIYGLNDQVTNRKSVSHINAGYAPLLFWDGRATGQFRDPVTNNVIINAGAALESQVLGPAVSTSEMAHNGRDWNDVASRVAASKPLALSPSIPASLNTWMGGRSYQDLFLETFGTTEITPTRIALAIGAYERSLYSDQTPLDLANAGIAPLTQQEQNGRNIFVVSSCAVCHAGNLMTDNSFRYIGVRPQNDDLGRFAVTGNNGDRGSFRVPSLRNVSLRGSFFHNGQFTTLEQVVAFYNRGGDFNAPNKPLNLIRPLGLNGQQQADLVAFLRRPMTDIRVNAETGAFDRPALYMGSSRMPAITGTGRSGSGGFTPQIKAISPPLVGNPNFVVSVSGAIGNANAVLVIDSVDPGAGSSIPTAGSLARVVSTTQNTGSGNGWTSVSVAIPDNQAIVGQTFFARWYVADPGAANGFSVSQAARFTVFGEATTNVNRAAHVDFDGDQKTDISIFRPSNGEWWYTRSGDSQSLALQFGSPGDVIVPADYTGDGKTDIAVWRQSTSDWLVLRSEDNSYFSVPFGQIGDVTVPGDYDADGRADIAIFRPSAGTWFIQATTEGSVIRQFGLAGDLPQVGDYDGDGRADLAIFRPSNGQWWLNRSVAGTIAMQFGSATDRPVAQDFTGDGKTDVAFFRPSSGEWFVLRSEDASYYSVPFGISTDSPAPGDYDGDGKADTAVFRAATGTWYINRSTQGMLITTFGSDGDLAAPSAYVR
ncbi:MAG: VCBS repeat-containing protein [Acidobacteria bacterium]|nr:VCBS repeat-containing protein [Acidobacteriota bacterium]MBK7935407.1 VCBS repeat-containing protein [Acidobacteriota bacterium]